MTSRRDRLDSRRLATMPIVGSVKWRISPIAPLIGMDAVVVTPSGNQKFLQLAVAENDSIVVTYEVTTVRNVGGRVVVDVIVQLIAGIIPPSRYQMRLVQPESANTDDLYKGPMVSLTTPIVTTQHQKLTEATTMVYSWTLDCDIFEGVPIDTAIRLVLDFYSHTSMLITSLASDIVRLADILPNSLREAPIMVQVGDTRVPSRMGAPTRIAVSYEGCNYAIDATIKLISPSQPQDGVDEITSLLATTTSIMYPIGAYDSLWRSGVMDYMALPLRYGHSKPSEDYSIESARDTLIFMPEVSGYITGATIIVPDGPTSEIRVDLVENTNALLATIIIPPRSRDESRSTLNVPFSAAVEVEMGVRYVLARWDDNDATLGVVKAQARCSPIKCIGDGNLGSSIDVLFDVSDIFRDPLGENSSESLLATGSGPIVAGSLQSHVLGAASVSPQILPRCVILDLAGTAIISENVHRTWGITQTVDIPTTTITLAGMCSNSHTTRHLVWRFVAQVEHVGYPKAYSYVVKTDTRELTSGAFTLDPNELYQTIEGSIYLHKDDSNSDYARLYLHISEPIIELDVASGETRHLGRSVVHEYVVASTITHSDPRDIITYDVTFDWEGEGAKGDPPGDVEIVLGGTLPTVLDPYAGAFNCTLRPRLSTYTEGDRYNPTVPVTGLLALRSGDTLVTSAVKYRV